MPRMAFQWQSHCWLQAHHTHTGMQHNQTRSRPTSRVNQHVTMQVTVNPEGGLALTGAKAITVLIVQKKLPTRPTVIPKVVITIQDQSNALDVVYTAMFRRSALHTEASSLTRRETPKVDNDRRATARGSPTTSSARTYVIPKLLWQQLRASSRHSNQFQ